MKTLLLFAGCWLMISWTKWEPNFDTALQVARKNHELILLNFSGSDWCGPCIRMRKEIFDNEAFLKMADTTLVMVNADFPRNKKNQPEKNIEAQNNRLADKYNSGGKFPLTLLLDENGKLIKSWDGLPKETAPQFAAEIRAIADARK